jgi:uncharacterized MAPEG superfamily protein
MQLNSGNQGALAMTVELSILAWTLVLAIFQILLPAALRTRETGVEYNAGPRDNPSPKPVGTITGRLRRAQDNLFQTLPLFAAAILIAHVAGRVGDLTAWGAWLYFVSRILYVPLYAAGVPFLRSLIWLCGLVGLLLILFAVLRPL